MDPFDLLKLIPDSIKTQVRDELVKFVTDQAKKHLGDDIANKLKKLRSDASFNQKFEQGLQRAVERFFAEYRLEDEDLVAAIAVNKEFFQNEEIQAALLKLIKNPGAYLDQEEEVVLQSFASVLPERLNRPRVDRAVSYLLKCLAQEVWSLPELQPIYSLQFQRMTAEATREQVALQRAQLQALTEMNAGIKDALLKLTDAMEQKLLTAPALPAPTPKPYHNLPRPDYDHFVGREAELAWLRQALHPTDRAWQIVIAGIGGVGKSALALAIAHEYREKYDELPSEERFDAIIWISAKEEVLTAQGREKADLPELVLRTLEDIYTAIATTLERQDITRATTDEQGALVKKALKQQRTLLVLDNLESVKDDRIKPFLRNLPSPTKAMITSREWVDVAEVLHLKGMLPEEANELITREAKSRQVSLQEAQRCYIYELTSGLPLPIKLTIARMAGGETFDAVTRWLGDATGDLPEYCIQGQAELIHQHNPHAWQLLLACSLFDRRAGASREALGYIVDISILERDRGIAQLQKLFLINRTEKDRFWALPIVQRYTSMQLGEHTRLSDTFTDRWITWLFQFSETYHSDQDLEIEPCQEFEEEYPNILQAIKFCYERKRWKELAELVKNTISYTVFTSSFIDFKEILGAASEALPYIDDEIVLGELELQMGRMGWWTTRIQREDDAHFEIAGNIFRKYRDSRQPEMWAKLLTTCMYLEKFEEAEELALDIYRVGCETNDRQLKYTAAYRMAEIKMWKRDAKWNPAEAKEWLTIAESMANQLEGPRNSAAVLYRQAAVYYAEGNLDEAESCLLRVLEMDVSRKDYRRVAYDKDFLAQILSQTGRTESAIQYAREAGELVERLGLAVDFARSRAFIEQLENSR